MKYIIVVIIILIGGVFYINRNKTLTGYADDNFAAAVKSKISKKVEDKKNASSTVNRVDRVEVRDATGSGSGEVMYKLTTRKVISKVKTVGINEDGETVPEYKTYNGKGSIDPSSGNYAKGTKVVITASPVSKNKVYWISGCKASGNTCTVTMDSDKTVDYSFVPMLSKSCSISNIALSILTKEIKCEFPWPGESTIHY